MKYQDIQIADVELQKQFANYWMNGLYQEALNLLDTNPQLDTKKFVNQIFNRIGNFLFIIESKYHEDFINALEIQLDNYNEAVSQFIYKKEWNEATDYLVGNNVLYQDDVYFCIQNNLNKIPTDINYWVKLGLRGPKGNYGIDVVIKYDWDNVVNYVSNDVVFYDESLWFALQDNVGQKPSSTSSYWSKFLNLPKTRIITSKNPPSVYYDGLIWNQILN